MDWKEIKVYLESKLEEVKKELNSVSSFEQLKQFRAKIRKDDNLLQIRKALKKETTKIQKKELGLIFSEFVIESKFLLDKKESELKHDLFNLKNDSDERNILLDGEPIKLSKYLKTTDESNLHPLTKLEFKFKEFFDALAYTFVYGNEIDTAKNNFDLLNISKNHASRSIHDTFYLDNDLLLRTQSTNVTAAKLVQSTEKNNYFYTIGTVFRNDDNDSTHSFQFNQLDLFVTGIKIKISDLIKVIDELLKFIFENDLETRYRISYFPFTEPSFEVDIKFEDSNKWIEVLGCGMINDQVLINTDFNPKEVNGFAAGIGLERIAMLKWNITDIRHFYQNDLKFLKGIK